MTSPSTTHLRDARRHPAAAFPSPAALAADASLSRAERIEMLQRWERDLEARAIADDEGMPPRRRTTDLRDVALALRSLGVAPNTSQTSSTSAAINTSGAMNSTETTGTPTDDGARRDVPYDAIPLGRTTAAEDFVVVPPPRRPWSAAAIVLGVLAILAMGMAFAGAYVLATTAGGLLILAALLLRRGRRPARQTPSSTPRPTHGDPDDHAV